MKIALVHDYLTQLGGGERVLAAFCEMFPEAPIYTLIYDEKRTGGVFKNKKIQTSFIQKIPGAKKFFRGFIWLMPLAIEQFDLSDFDLVISVPHSYGKGIITKPATKHICYCLTPTRYLWHDAGLPFKLISQPILTYLRVWDYQAAQRPDYFIACSENVRQRIKKYYGREAKVIYPPVSRVGIVRRADSEVVLARSERSHALYGAGRSEAKRPMTSEARAGRDENERAELSPHEASIKNYFLMVGRLVPYKRFDIAIDAFAKMPNEKLLIIGDGPEKKKLEGRSKKLGAKNVKFLGRVSDSELAGFYANSKALIFPQEEDFGIVPLEAMAVGRPVIAFRAGGARETIIEGETGIFFNDQKPDSLIKAVKNFDDLKFDFQKIHEHSKKFNSEVFKSKITGFIKNLT